MIKIFSATTFTVSKATEERWGFGLADRTYLVETGFREQEVDHSGLRAVLAVSLTGQTGVTEGMFDELDSTINDMLRLWNEGQVVLIDARQVPFQYSLEVDEKKHVDFTKYYLDVTGVMNEIEGDWVKRLVKP